MDLEIQEYLDDLFYSKFKLKPRSQGVFCTGDIDGTREYGRCFIIFPVGNYQYLWNPRIFDLYQEIYDNLDWNQLIVRGRQATGEKAYDTKKGL